MKWSALAFGPLVFALAVSGCGDDMPGGDVGMVGEADSGVLVSGDGGTGDGSTLADGGELDASQASDGSAGRSDANVDDAGVSPGLAPIIPEPDGACPMFSTGTQTIQGLETDILAGTPGATPGPLLFTWHGTGGSGTRALNVRLPASVRASVTEQGGLVIAPNSDGTFREGFSPNGVWFEGSDLEYADHIVACAIANHNIDPRRVYVTGCSAGGLMAAAMAIKRSNYVAAAAPNSGGLVTTLGVSLQDGDRVPAVIAMHGGRGDTVIVNFQRTSERLANFLEPAGAFVVDCNHESGHCGASDQLHERAWEFMEAHPFGTTTSPYEGGLPSAFPSYCRIW